jgi:hypothetical protein
MKCSKGYLNPKLQYESVLLGIKWNSVSKEMKRDGERVRTINGTNGYFIHVAMLFVSAFTFHLIRQF